MLWPSFPLFQPLGNSQYPVAYSSDNKYYRKEFYLIFCSSHFEQRMHFSSSTRSHPVKYLMESWAGDSLESNCVKLEQHVTLMFNVFLEDSRKNNDCLYQCKFCIICLARIYCVLFNVRHWEQNRQCLCLNGPYIPVQRSTNYGQIQPASCFCKCFIGMQPCLPDYVLSVASFLLHWQSCLVAIKTTWPIKLKYLLCGLL